MDSKTIFVASLAAFIWPILVPSIYVIFRWKIISGKLALWFMSSFVGYVLFIGVPILIREILVILFGADKSLLDALKNPNHKWFVEYYWLILIIVAIVLVLLPVVSTHYLFNRRLKKG